MPDIRILKALKMTAAEWGQLPIDGDERANLRQKALDILAGICDPVQTREQMFVQVEQARVDALKNDHLTRAGFESAMVQQAQAFGEAVNELREKMKGSLELISNCSAEINALAGRLTEAEKTIVELKKG